MFCQKDFLNTQLELVSSEISIFQPIFYDERALHNSFIVFHPPLPTHPMYVAVQTNND